VDARHREAAEAAAVKEFGLDDEQRCRLVVSERSFAPSTQQRSIFAATTPAAF
jgi:hypothetical protein